MTDKGRLINFNKLLHKFQNLLIKEIIKFDSTLIQRVSNPQDDLFDYEIDLHLLYYEKDNDTPIASCCFMPVGKYLSQRDLTKEDFWGDRNHNEYQNWDWHDMSHEHHCYLYHDLYDHRHLSWEEILHIVKIQAKLEIYYQYKISTLANKKLTSFYEQLRNFQKKLVNESKKLEYDLKQRVKNPKDILESYKITLSIDCYSEKDEYEDCIVIFSKKLNNTSQEEYQWDESLNIDTVWGEIKVEHFIILVWN